MKRGSFLIAIMAAAAVFAQIRRPQPNIIDPVPFQSKDGKITGWRITIPGERPLATPAVVDGKVFLGGGFGSHEFYAFDAATGQRLWTYQTTDDGPTAAVVENGYIVFNTESCELEIITTNGKPVWKKWLGDPLMSMPAVADGKVYMAYPNSRGDKKHYVAAFDLRTGKELWTQPIAGEIITAPVLDEKRVYLASVEGTLFSFQQDDGKLLWQEKKNATSAPVVWNQQCYFARREETAVSRNGKTVAQQNEVVAVRGTAAASPTRGIQPTFRAADYLDYAKRAKSPREEASQSLDATVGFAGAAKGDAKILLARANLGQASVHGVWAYQGSKPFIDGGRLYSSMGDTVQSVDPKTEKVFWKKTLHDKKEAELLDSMLTPPAIVNGKLFVGTIFGEVMALSAQSGDVLWKAEIGEPIVFQPAVSKGRVYVSTSKGSLYCLNTGDVRDDGWLMWGANATHNGLR